MTIQIEHEPAPSAPRGPSEPPTDRVGFVLVAMISVMALVVALFAFVLRLGDDEPDGGAATGGDAAAAEVPVSLTEFAISPDPVRVASGGSLMVTNDGATIHNLAVKGASGLTTADLAAGEDAVLDLSGLAAGTYTVVCTIPGHEAAGMAATLEVAEGAGAAGAAGGHGAAGAETDWAALDEAMMQSMLRFPAETEGLGNQKLAPEIAADGTKVFELTAEITEWEVEPGKVVEAWTYNGQVPGPWIDVEVGDRVRVNVHNRLPMGTDVHWHGIHTPNDQDGVAPYTQDLIRSGQDHTYEFVAEDPAVGMYHAHHHAQMQVVNGMFGAFTIGDVPLPTGRTIGGIEVPADVQVADEIPMVLNDAGVIGFSLNGKSFPATAPVAANQGDWILVHYYNEGLGAHPMHLHQFPQLVVAKDGIPLDYPYWADTVNVAAGERYSVLVNLSDPGTWVWHCHILTHVERETGMFGMVTAIVVQ